MTAAVSTTPEYTSSSLTRPQDGERAGIDSGPAPLWTLLQALFNRAHFAQNCTWGQLIWTGHLAVSGTAASPVVTLGVIDAVALRDGNSVWRPYNATSGATLGASHVEGGGSLAVDTWYHVYCWADSSTPNTLKYQISTSPPTESGTPTVLQHYKRGQTANYRYLGCFRTDGSGNPLPMRAVRGRYVYQFSAISVSGGHRVLSAGTDTSATEVACSAVVPPHVRLARLLADVRRSGAAGYASFTTAGDSTNRLSVNVGSGGGICTAETEMLLNASQKLDYLVDNASTTCTLHVLGFSE
jgi:hypothetical protein